MRGHRPILDLRRRGLRPRLVSFTLDDTDPIADDWHAFGIPVAFVAVPRTDSIATLDLRFVVGMPVQIAGRDDARCQALHERCIDAGACRVATAILDARNRVQTQLIGHERFERGRDFGAIA